MHGIYRELELNPHITPKKHMTRAKPEPLMVYGSMNAMWSRDFMHDRRTGGRAFRLCHVIGHFKRETVGTEVNFSLSVRARNTKSYSDQQNGEASRKFHATVTVKNVLSAASVECAKNQEIKIGYIQPGKPQQNACVERFNRTVNYE
jgi:putative transposase